jgi:hypothetical protein
VRIEPVLLTPVTSHVSLLKKKEFADECVNLAERTPYFVDTLVASVVQNGPISLHISLPFPENVDSWLTHLAKMLSLLGAM